MTQCLSQTDRRETSGALCDACVMGDLARARQLLDADPALVNALEHVHEPDIESAHSMGGHDGWSPLHLAAHYGNLEMVRLLVDRGADLEAISHNSLGNTPISAAAFANHKAIVTYLISCGAKIDAPNSGGNTALHRAIIFGRHDMTEFLIEQGADVKLKNGQAKSPLALARESGRPNMVQLLIERGA